MIGYLNPPLQDELLLNLCARYKGVFGLSDAATCLDLFGVPKMHSIVSFPSRLGYFEQQVPEAFGINAALLIRDHTLLPFFVPFMTPDELEEIVQAVRGNASDSQLTRLYGASAAPEYLRYCVECAEADRMGPEDEAHWRRLHQIGGIKVCPTHEVFLVDSEIRISGRARFVSAESSIGTRLTVRRIDRKSAEDVLLLWIAEQAKWLLANGMAIGSRAENLPQIYAHYLRSAGLMTCNGTLMLGKFNRMLLDRIGASLLERLGCTLETRSKNNWARRLVKGQEHHCHPIKHLLLIRCFGLEVEEFLSTSGSTPVSDEPFEAGPWPCLNPACSDYNRTVVSERRIRVDHRGQLFGIFSCRCGYTYSRRGPDPSGQTRHSVHKVISTGRIWDNALRKLWKNPKIPVYEIGAKLHSYHYPIMQAVVRLELPLNRSGLKTPPLVHRDAGESLERFKRKQYRSSFLVYRREHPKLTRTQLQRGKSTIAHIVEWLRSHDRQWLQKHMPNRANSKHSQGRSGRRTRDWQTMDSTLEARVAIARQSLLAAQDKPKRISRNALLVELGYSHGLSRSHFPRTIEAIKGAEESLQKCAARRVYWLLEQQERSSAYQLSLDQLKVDARIRPGWEKHLEIAEALKHASEFAAGANMASILQRLKAS